MPDGINNAQAWKTDGDSRDRSWWVESVAERLRECIICLSLNIGCREVFDYACYYFELSAIFAAFYKILLLLEVVASAVAAVVGVNKSWLSFC